MFNGIKKYFKSLFSKKQRHKLRDVFTPSSTAEIAYIKRESLEKNIERSLDIKGKQLVIYGHSGSGKTTILNYVLMSTKKKYVKSSCTNESTIIKIISDAFDDLEPYYIDSYSTTKKDSVTASLSNDYKAIKSSIDSQKENSETETTKRVLPPQLTMQRLGKFIGEAKAVWIIEDFHKVPEDEKKNISQMMKMFMDLSNDYPELKIVVLGAAEEGSDVVAHDPELNNRISEIEIPPLSESEIEQILKKGAIALNICFTQELIQSVAKYSNYLATIAHQLAYNLCYNRGITETQKTLITIEKKELSKAIDDFTNDKQNSYKTLYNEATKHRNVKYANVRIILEALCDFENEDVTHGHLLSAIQQQYPDYPPSNLSNYIKKLSTPTFDGVEILRTTAGNISYSDPFFKSYVKMRKRDSATLDSRG